MSDENSDPKLFELKVKKIDINWKIVIPIVFTLVGSLGGYASWRLISYAEAKEMISKTEERIEYKYNDLSDRVEENTSVITEVKKIITDVQTIQHNDIAIREARRISEQIKCQKWDQNCLNDKENTKERLRRLNIRRLIKNLEPCANQNCTN